MVIPELNLRNRYDIRQFMPAYTGDFSLCFTLTQNIVSHNCHSKVYNSARATDELNMPLPKSCESSTGSLLSASHSLDAFQECLLSSHPHYAVCTRGRGEGIANMAALVSLVVSFILWIPSPDNNLLINGNITAII